MTGQDSRLVSNTREWRRAERLPLTFQASLRERGTTKFSVDIRDLSTTGFRCETSFNVQVGAVVWLTIPGLGGLESRAKWREGNLYGFAFSAALHPAVLDHIARQQAKR